MSEPDYTTYSSKDLISVTKHLDRDRYPERYARVLEEIERRKSDDYQAPAALSPSADKAASKRANRTFWAILVLLIGIGVVAVGVTSAKRSQEAQAAMEKSQRPAKPVRAAIEEQYADERIDVRLDRSGGRLMIVLTATNLELGESTEEDRAKELAVVAYGAFAKQRQLDGVKVAFATETKKFLSTETEVGETHELSSDELRELLQ